MKTNAIRSILESNNYNHKNDGRSNSSYSSRSSSKKQFF